MTNSEKFKDVFGLYATELWAMPQEDFLNWINTEYKEFESVQLDLISKQETIDILKAIKHGLWEIDIPSPGNVPEYVEHHKQIKDMMEVVDGWIKKVLELPSEQPDNKFLDFLWNTINPNEMEKYLSMYHSSEEKTDGSD